MVTLNDKQNQALLSPEVDREWLDVTQEQIQPLPFYPTDEWGEQLVYTTWVYDRGKHRTRNRKVFWTDQYQVPNLEENWQAYLKGLALDLDEKALVTYMGVISHTIYGILDRCAAIDSKDRRFFLIKENLHKVVTLEWHQVSLQHTAEHLQRTCKNGEAYTSLDSVRSARNKLACLGCFDVESSYEPGRQRATVLKNFNIPRLLHIYEYLEHVFISRGNSLDDLPPHKHFIVVMAHKALLGYDVRRIGCGSSFIVTKDAFEERLAEQERLRRLNAIKSSDDAETTDRGLIRRRALEAWERIGGSLIPTDSFSPKFIAGELKRTIESVIDWFINQSASLFKARQYNDPDIDREEIVKIGESYYILSEDDVQYQSKYMSEEELDYFLPY